MNGARKPHRSFLDGLLTQTRDEVWARQAVDDGSWEVVLGSLGKLGVFWHTQGSGKSYSMAFFAEKVRRRISAQLHVPADDRPQRSG